MIAPLDVGPLGPTGIETTRLGLGAGALGGHLWKVTPEQAVETVVRTYELGVRHADTSPLYGDSENRIGTALRGHEFPGLTISTKVGTHRTAHTATPGRTCAGRWTTACGCWAASRWTSC